MNRGSVGLVIAIAFSVMALGGCNRKTESSVDWQKRKNEACQEINKRILQLQNNLQTLKSEADKLGDQAKENYRKASAEMQPRINALKIQAARLQSQAADQWEKARIDLNQALDALQVKYEKAKADLMSSSSSASPGSSS